jgi:sulfide:quinone oxidoreductase
VTFRDQRDAPQLERLLDDLRNGDVHSIAFAAPAGVTWTLPVYELALLAAREIEEHGLRTSVSVVTPERSTLQVFGREISELVSGILAERNIRTVLGAAPRLADGRTLHFADGGAVGADRVVAVPALVGQRIAGVPADYGGFVATRAFGRVEGLADVYAVGDMTSFPVKQGGLAAQQADAAASVIALNAGASPAMPPLTSVLRAQLFGTPEPLFLETTLDLSGRPLDGAAHTFSEAPWWPGATLFGRHITPWMAGQALQAA